MISSRKIFENPSRQARSPEGAKMKIFEISFKIHWNSKHKIIRIEYCQFFSQNNDIDDRYCSKSKTLFTTNVENDIKKGKTEYEQSLQQNKRHESSRRKLD